MSRIYLSPPHLTGHEQEMLNDALASNWVAPLGPHVDAFEAELAAATGVAGAAALSSGTAALHLALVLAGVGPGQEVICPTFTFVGSVNPVLYVGARPIFVDVSPETWTIDVEMLASELLGRSKRGRLPAAVLAVDIYGQCADYQAIQALCDEYEVALIEDAAEALGASAYGKPAGGFGRVGALSFNGNKIVTTSGGGALVSDDLDAIDRARYLASQARLPAPHYEHSDVGYNYRLSNLLAAVGRAQLAELPGRVAARRAIFDRYVDALGGMPGIEFMPEAAYGLSNRWLTTLTVDERLFGVTAAHIQDRLAEADIEARPLWKPMHLQRLFAGAETVGGSVAESLFAKGLCLPSGSSLGEDQQARVIAAFLGANAN